MILIKLGTIELFNLNFLCLSEGADVVKYSWDKAHDQLPG